MSLFGSQARTSSKNLVQFRAGKMNLKDTTVTADKRKGQLYVHQGDDALMHLCWKDRTSGVVEDDLIIFPEDCELKRVAQCTTGRVFVLKFKSSSRKMFFWMQEPKTDKDEEYCKKVNDALNNPPQPGQGQPSAADLGGLEAMNQGSLQDLFSNMDQQQLLQLMAAGGGLGNLLTPGRTSQRSRNQSSRNKPPSSTSAPAEGTTAPTTTTATGSTPAAPASAQLPTVQLSQLQDILSSMGVPKVQPKETVDLAEAITPETMIPILADPKVQERLKPFLPQGETLKSTAEELRETVHSPSFRQAMSSFSSALASGQLGPLLKQFGLPEAAQVAASKGDVEGFAKAMQEEGKKDDPKEENMSVD